jgi:hypothetical protein
MIVFAENFGIKIYWKEATYANYHHAKNLTKQHHIRKILNFWLKYEKCGNRVSSELEISQIPPYRIQLV